MKFWRRIAIFSKYIGYVYLSRYRPVLPCFKSFGVPGMKKRKIVGWDPYLRGLIHVRIFLFFPDGCGTMIFSVILPVGYIGTKKPNGLVAWWESEPRKVWIAGVSWMGETLIVSKDWNGWEGWIPVFTMLIRYTIGWRGIYGLPMENLIGLITIFTIFIIRQECLWKSKG